MNVAMAIALLVGGTIFAIIVSVLLNGYVLSVLWGWFIVPVFGLPALSIPVAIGLALVVSFLTKDVTIDDSSDKQNAGKKLVVIMLRPLLVLFTGWIVKQWM